MNFNNRRDDVCWTRQQVLSRHSRRQGFSLIELMIALAIVAILAAIALPAYQKHVVRGKRGAAQVQMLDIANREEQYLLANRTYADKSTLTGNGYGLPAEVSANYNYDITLGAAALPSYTITFTAINAQASDGDLTLTSEGVKSPAEKW